MMVDMVHPEHGVRSVPIEQQGAWEEKGFALCTGEPVEETNEPVEEPVEETDEADEADDE